MGLKLSDLPPAMRDQVLAKAGEKPRSKKSRAGSLSRLPPADRLWARVDKSGSCWLWTGTTSEDGYGRFVVGGKSVFVHRWVYVSEVGPLGPGLTVDHRCHNEAAEAGECAGGQSCQHRRCVNPTHLAALTPRENTMASPVSPSGENARRTECVSGHPFDDENTGWYPTGRRRYCKACKKRRDAELIVRLPRRDCSVCGQRFQPRSRRRRPQTVCGNPACRVEQGRRYGARRGDPR